LNSFEQPPQDSCRIARRIARMAQGWTEQPNSLSQRSWVSGLPLISSWFPLILFDVLQFPIISFDFLRFPLNSFEQPPRDSRLIARRIARMAQGWPEQPNSLARSSWGSGLPLISFDFLWISPDFM
jgi:hypothetical protein